MKLVKMNLTQELRYCPVTGADLYDMKDGQLPSPAMKFMTIDGDTEVYTANVEIEKAFIATQDEADDKGLWHYDVLASHYKDKENWLCLVVTLEEMDCGPNATYNVYCFDMNYQED